MSIIPIDHQQGGAAGFDPFSALDLWDPFADFPFPGIFRPFHPLGSSVNSRLDWRETRNAHVLTASFPAFGDEDVLVELQDSRFLQISTDSGSFVTRVKLPETAKIEELKAFMNGGVLTVTLPKAEAEAGRSNVRVVEITGED